MKIWLTCVFLLFAFAELYQWAKTLSVPLPIYILGGACLAIASNYNKLNGWAVQIPFFQSNPIINSGNNPANLINSSPQQPQLNSNRLEPVQPLQPKNLD